MKDSINFGEGVPDKVKEMVMDQVRAGDAPIQVPEGYNVRAETGDSALDVSITIHKIQVE